MSKKMCKGAPPMDGRRYLLRFKGSTDSDDIICTGSYRYGRPYNEPAPNTKAWRCDCCGKFSDPYYWAEIPKRPDEQVNAAIRGMEGKMTVRTGVKWELQRTPYESEIDIVSDGRVIATVEAGADKEMIAHLINAAPEMHIALQNVRVELDSYPHCPFCGSVHGEGHEKDCIGYEVEAAIRKARDE